MKDKQLNFCSIFIDFDGTIIHQANNMQWKLDMKAAPCPGTINKLNEWYSAGHKIFITTARTLEDLDKMTKWLSKHKVKYTRLILNCGCGPRYIINDNDPELQINKAVAVCITRNSGLENVALSHD